MSDSLNVKSGKHRSSIQIGDIRALYYKKSQKIDKTQKDF